MEHGKFVVFLFLIYETSFYLVMGQTISEERNDCTKFYNFINGGFEYYDNEICCSGSDFFFGIDCDYEGNFISFERYQTKIEILDLTNFPYFSKIKNLLIDNIDNVGVSLKEIPNSILNLSSLENLNLQYNHFEVIPPDIKKLTELKTLNLYNNNIKELPNELFELHQLESLIFYKNNIEVIPPAIQNLSNLKNLNIGSNIIKELPKELFNLKNLKNLLIFNNTIEIIPPDIQKLTKLEHLQLNNNNIKKLPNEIFKLPNLNTLELSNNPNLNTKMIRFGDSIIENCYFDNITISCYEPKTCKTIHVNGEKLNNFDAENKYRECTKEEIDEIKNSNNNKNGSSFILIGGIIIGCIIVVFNVLFISYIITKERRSKRTNSSNISNNDISRNENINSLLNNDDNNNSNNNAEINNRNGYNDNINNDNTQNNLNQNIVVNTMNADYKNEANIYSASAIESEPPLPEYSDINHLV